MFLSIEQLSSIKLGDSGMSDYSKIHVFAVNDDGAITDANPCRAGSAKRTLFGWAIEQENGFTKAEFLDAAAEMHKAGQVQSKMEPERFSKAWWNEFYSKFKTFRLDEDVVRQDDEVTE